MGDIAELYDYFIEDEAWSTPRCRYCGSDIYWQETDDGWRPYSVGGRRHSCKAFKRSRIAKATDFAVIDGTADAQ